MLSVKLLTNPLLTVLRVVRGSLDIPRNKRESSSSLTTVRSKALSYLHNSFPTVSTRWAAGCPVPQQSSDQQLSPGSASFHSPGGECAAKKRWSSVWTRFLDCETKWKIFIQFFFFNPTSLFKLPKKQPVPFWEVIVPCKRELLFPRFTEVRSKAAATQSRAEVPALAVLAQS